MGALIERSASRIAKSVGTLSRPVPLPAFWRFNRAPLCMRPPPYRMTRLDALKIAQPSSAVAPGSRLDNRPREPDVEVRQCTWHDHCNGLGRKGLRERDTPRGRTSLRRLPAHGWRFSAAA